MVHNFNIVYLIKVLVSLVGVFLLSFFVGSAVAFESYRVIIIIFAIFGGVLLLKIPDKYVLSLQLFLAFFIVGQALYFAGIRQAPWIVYGFGLMMYLKVIPVYSTFLYKENKKPVPLVILITLFIFTAIISGFINTVPGIQLIVGLRDLVYNWSLFFLIAFGAISTQYLDKVWKSLFYVLLFQVPLVLYQLLVVSQGRIVTGAVGAAWDSVVGGFGGDPLGGGASSSLVVFVVIIFSYMTLLFRKGLVSLKKYLLVLFSVFLIIILAEVKVVVVLLPVALLILFRDKIRKDLFKFLLLSFSMLFFVVVLFTAYKYQKTGTFEGVVGLDYVYEESFERQLDFTHERKQTGEIGRATVFAHWWNENGMHDPVHTFFGYGPGATKRSSLVYGEVAKKYYYYPNLARSVGALLLWELGLVGIFLLLLILFKSIYVSRKLLRNSKFDEYQKTNIETAFISLVLFLITVPYSSDMLKIPAVNLYFMFILGYLTFMYRISEKKLEPS